MFPLDGGKLLLYACVIVVFVKDYFWFSARLTFVDNKNWLWIPRFHSLSGKNLAWNKGFKTEAEAINFLEVNLGRIEQDWL